MGGRAPREPLFKSGPRLARTLALPVQSQDKILDNWFGTPIIAFTIEYEVLIQSG